MEEKTKNAFDGLRAGLRKVQEKLQTRAKNLRGQHVAAPSKALTRADLAQVLEEMARDVAELGQALDDGLKKPVGTWGRQ
jgi:DNA anti-recombination protein RmuC